jgi:hypothetical protein
MRMKDVHAPPEHGYRFGVETDSGRCHLAV